MHYSVSQLREPLPALEPALLQTIGTGLFGRHWQADIARETAKHKSLIYRFNSTEEDDRRTPNFEFGLLLSRAMVDKIEDVTKLLNHPVLPHHDKQNVVDAVKLLNRAVQLLRKTSPAVERVTIEETSNRTRSPGPKPRRRKRQKK